MVSLLCSLPEQSNDSDFIIRLHDMIQQITKATNQQIKSHNLRLIFKMIYTELEVSRAEISRVLGLTRSTVSGLVAELMADGLVEEVGKEASRGGKRARLLSVINNSRQLISIDSANQIIRGAVVNLRGNVIIRVEKSANGRFGTELLTVLTQLIDDLLEKTSSPILGISLGIPGLVNSAEGIICEAEKLGWADLPLKELLTDRYHLPIYVVNDSHAAALGEYAFGKGTAADNLVVLCMGPGVSAGIVLNGRLHAGDGYGAGEIGHIPIVRDGKPCVCGNFGCLETVVSRRVLFTAAANIMAENPHSPLHQIVASPADLTTDLVLQAYEAGDTDLHQVIVEMGEHLGFAIASLVGTLNIQTILVSGSMSRFGESLLESIQCATKKYALPRLSAATEIQFGSLGQDSVIQGAAALLLAEELGLI